MSGLFSQASGIIIKTACGSERPPRWSSSRTSSKLAESLAPGVQTGDRRVRSPERTSLVSMASRVVIQFRFPATVLISPL